MLKLNLRVFKYDFDVADVAKDMIGLSYSDIERVCKDSIKKTILNDKKVLRIETMVGMLEKEKERQSMITGFSE
jgi:AAA+ superfamily predicted ATPase